jgi:hypothetical protein
MSEAANTTPFPPETGGATHEITREVAMGAGVFCVVCGARPYPELGPPGTREDFDLMRLDGDGRPAESPA